MHKILNAVTAFSAAVSTLALMAPDAALAQAAPTKAEKAQRQALDDVPHCTRKLGTISIVDGDDARGWTQYNLAPPQKLLKVIVQRSGCFNLVDRGSGLQAAQRERDIAGDLGHQRGSNVGQGQIKAADYVLQAEVQAANGNASGSRVGGGLGGLVGGGFGAVLGSIHTRKMEANTVLSVTNVRTTETIATTEGYAVKNSVSFGAGGGGFFGSGAVGLVGGGYDNTDIGRIVTMSFLDAYAKLVNQLGGIQQGATGTAEATPAKTFQALAPVVMHKTPAANGLTVRSLAPGAILYPTGNKQGLWWEVADENDNVGWVLNTKIGPTPSGQ